MRTTRGCKFRELGADTTMTHVGVIINVTAIPQVRERFLTVRFALPLPMKDADSLRVRHVL